MNRSTHLIALGLGLLLLGGCRSNTEQYQRRVSLTLLEPVRPSKPVEEITAFENKNEVTEEYDIVALMQAEGYPEEVSLFKTAFRQRAADVGADAVIFKRINLDQGTGVRLTDVAAFRGEAIVFR